MYLSKVDYEINFYIFAHEVFKNNNMIVSICFVFMRQACGVMCHVNIIESSLVLQRTLVGRDQSMEEWCYKRLLIVELKERFSVSKRLENSNQ